jgi:hypothetical protein
MTVDFSKIRRRVAHILSLPIDDSNPWTLEQEQTVLEIIQEGLRLFYSPPEVDAFGQHSWTFFYQQAEMSTIADVQTYTLPPSFDHFDNDAEFTYTNDDEYYLPIKIVNDSKIRKLDYQIDYTSFPRYAATRPVKVDGSSVQRWEIVFHPTPNSEYRLAYEFYAVPYMISLDNPIPLGGGTHGQCILKACEAAAEEYEYDKRGDKYQHFLEQLKTDIKRDARRQGAVQGYNGNHSIVPYRSRAGHRRAQNIYSRNVTYNGLLYNG